MRVVSTAVFGLCVLAGMSIYLARAVWAKIGTPPANEAERLVRKQVEVFNRHDLDAFLACYASDVKFYQFPDKLLYSGLDSMREAYGRMFRAEPDLKVEITHRIVQGDFVIDHESGNRDGRKIDLTVIYQVKDGKIVAVWAIK